MTGKSLNVWRFVDGKAGHERQTEGLIQALSESVEPVVTVVDVSGGCPGGLRKTIKFLRRRKDHPKPDILIGAGHGTHLPMILGRIISGAKSVVLMKPSFPRWCFDFCIVPECDRVPESGNTCIVQGVLNTMTRGRHQDAAEGLILIGGPCRHVDWSDATLLRQVEGVVRKSADVRWTMTTSRRTPTVLCGRLAKLKARNLHYASHQVTGPHWVSEGLDRSGQVWVSPDSVSMVFEALTSGSCVGVFDLAWKPGSKLKMAVDRLIDERMVTPYSEFMGNQAIRQSGKIEGSGSAIQ